MEKARTPFRLKDRIVTMVAALATVLSVIVVSAAPAGAATLDVCSTSCTYSTISDALAASSDLDIITVGVGTYNETITVTTDVTIERTEATGTVTIDGGDAGSVVTVTSGTTATLRNLTIRNGTAIDGGGIHNEGDLTLERVDVFENVAEDPSASGLGRGGGIFNAGTIDIQRGNVNSNSGEWGGGIANLGMLTSFGMTMSSNLADSDLGGGGAALANIQSAASATIEAALFVNNYARDVSTSGRGGGALWANGGTVTIEGSILRLNRSDVEAGAIYATGTSEVTIRDSVIYESSANSSAAIYSRASLTIEDSTIGPNNVASSVGGAIRVGSTSTVTMRNSTISGNTSGGSGGGAYVEGTLALDSVTIAENTASDGGGVLVTGGSSGGTLTSENSIIANNTGTSSGPDCWGALSTATTVLISDTSNCTITGTAIVADPLLGPLEYNGGPWFINTHLPAVGSPAIDNGTTSLTTDQRGLPRPSGSGPDIGSVEIQTATDNPPVITPIDDPTINEGEPLTVTPVVADPDGDPFTLTWSGVPTGATTGDSLSWTPAEDQGPGNYLVTVTATQDDDPSLSDSESFTIMVSEVNTAPDLDPISDRTAAVGQELAFTATATDPDIPGQNLEFSLGTGAPVGASIDPGSGLFTWTPDATQLGGTSVTVIVSDGAAQDSQTFFVSVVEAAIEADVFVSAFEIIDLDPDGDGDILSQTPVVFEIEYGANALYGDAPDATIIIDYESIADTFGEFAGVVALDLGPCDFGSGGIGAGEILVCDVGPITSGEVRSFTIVLEPTYFSFGGDYEVDVDFATRIETTALEPDLGPFDNNELRLLATVRARQADLQPALSKFVPLLGTPQPVFFGETSLFEMQALNLGPDIALDTTLTLTWRPEAWELASTPSGCTFVDESTGLTCAYGDLFGEPGTGVSGGPETVVGLTETGGPSANHDLTVVTGTASVDPFPGNNSSTLEVTPQDRESDVSISDLRVFLGDPDGDGVVRSGDEITYRARISNAGPNASVDTSVIISFAGQFGNDVEVTDAGGCTPFSGVFPSLNQGLNCDIGLLAQFGFKTVEFTVRIPTNESGLWVVVADAQTGSVDPDETNDAQSNSLEVLAIEADLSTFVLLSTLSDVDQDGDMWLGDTARYTITAVNDGPDTAENARVLVTVGATEGVDYQFGTGFACTAAGTTGGFPTYECPVGKIDSGGFTPFASAFVPIEWLTTGTFAIHATAESDLPDLDSTNDTSSFVTVVQDPSGDSDGDGIENAIDGYRADPTNYNSFVYDDGLPSIQFSDQARVGQSGAGTTFGRVIVALPDDLVFRIIDDPVNGITVATGGSVTDWIDLRACAEDRPVRVWGQSTVDISCGSITVAVASGRATVTLADGSTVDIGNDSTVRIDDADELTVQTGTATLTSGPFVIVLEAGDTLIEPGGDADGDGLTGIEEAFVGTDPEIDDTDGDGVGDAIDVDWLRSAIESYERSDFANNGKIKAISSILDDIVAEVRILDFEEAAALVRNLSRHSDGCPDEPDNNDWIVDCEVQADWMDLLDLYERGLSSG